MTRTIAAEKLTAEAFARFGHVLDVPAAGRVFHDDALRDLRPGVARASLSLLRMAPVSARPVPVARIERHAFSSQAFVPLAPFRYLAGVAPRAGDGPDVAALRVFLVAPGQGVSYGADVWHLPMTVLDGDGTFAIVMFNDGTAGDAEIRDMPPLAVTIPG